MLNTVNHVGGSIVTGLTATGNSQSTALQLAGRNSLQEVTTVSASTGVLLPVISLPASITIANQGASTLNVYPQSGGTIDNGSANAAATIAAGKAATYEASSLTNWYTVSVTATGGLTAIADKSVMGNTSGGSAAPAGVTLTAMIDEAIGGTQGDILYRGASGWSALAPGTTGQVLASQGAGENLIWTSAVGTGTVTSVTAGTGLAGGTFTTTGTVSLAVIADKSILGNTSGGSAAPSGVTLTAMIDEAIGSTQGDILYRGASAWSALAPGTTGQVLASQGAGENLIWTSATGSGTVTSVEFVGDGTVLSSTPSAAVTTSGTVPATLANAAAYTHLANQTGSSAAPTYCYGLDGVASATITTIGTTLAISSPSVILCALTGAGAINLPAASTCPGKVFWFTNTLGNHAPTITCNAADTVSTGGATISVIATAGNPGLAIISGGSLNTWYVLLSPLLSTAAGGTGNGISASDGNLIYAVNTGTFGATASPGTSGQLWQSNGGAAPTATSAPGSGTALTSVGTKAVNNSATQTVVNGSAGSYTWSQPEQGTSYKNVVIYLSGYTNSSTSAIVFATAFTNTPGIILNGTSLSISTISASGVTIPTATTQTGFIILAGY